MDIKQLNQKINEFLKNTLKELKEFPGKFKKMSLGEQVAYGCIALGGLLIIISLFLLI